MSSDVIPRRQFPQLYEANCGAQLVHPVIKTEDRYVIIRTATCQTLPGVTCHSMGSGSPDRIAQGSAPRNDRPAFSGGHVLVAVKAECGRIAERSDRWQPWCMSGILDQK